MGATHTYIIMCINYIINIKDTLNVDHASMIMLNIRNEILEIRRSTYVMKNIALYTRHLWV